MTAAQTGAEPPPQSEPSNDHPVVDQSVQPALAWSGFQPSELVSLTALERLSVRLVQRMNRGRWKRIWTACQRHLGSLWIYLATYNLMQVYGLENLASVSRDVPLLLVANHRSFFDMYTVSSVLYRRTNWIRALYFPVRGRFFYQSPVGWLVNLVMGWWSMFPPFFYSSEKRAFDKAAMRTLVEICREGVGVVIGFHPEGTRNKSADPYSFLRAQPGVGKLILDAQPQVVPVFIAGLSNQLPRQVLSNWSGGAPIRIWFGPSIDFSEFYGQRDSVRTYKQIADFAMSKVAELAAQDRAHNAAPAHGADAKLTNQEDAS